MTKIFKQNVRLKFALQSFGRSVLALAASLLIAGIIIRSTGYSPFAVYGAVFTQSFSSIANVALCFSQATPLIFSGISFAMGIRVGLVNTGVEGQLLTGAMFSALAGAYITFLPGPFHLVFCLLAGALGGGLIALFTTLLRVKSGASEVIIGIMLNNIINLFTQYLAIGPLRPQGSSIGQTKEILPSAILPRLIPRTQMTYAVVIAVAVAIALHILFKQTVLGYKMLVVGRNRRAGMVAGINSSRIYLLTAFIFGAVAGLGGAVIVQGVYFRFIDGLSMGYGFAGIPVAALASYNPIGVLFSGLLFGILRAGTATLSRTTEIPLEIVSVIQALVVVFVSAPTIITSVRNLKRFKRNRKKDPVEENCIG